MFLKRLQPIITYESYYYLTIEAQERKDRLLTDLITVCMFHQFHHDSSVLNTGVSSLQSVDTPKSSTLETKLYSYLKITENSCVAGKG